MEKKKKFKDWVKENQTEIIHTGSAILYTACVFGMLYYSFKKAKRVKALMNS